MPPGDSVIARLDCIRNQAYKIMTDYFDCQVESATQRISNVTPGDAVKKKQRTASWTRSEPKSSDEISSSSDESVSTDAGHVSPKPYMHE